LKYGPDLLGIFIPVGSLIGNATKFIAEKAGWLERLKRLSRPTNVEASSQELLFEQYTRFLFSIAEQIPLLIVLDDLHWADLGTLDLLFYILRRLKNRKDLRLLIVGAFRESDVYSGDPGIRHPLETIINETKLAFGNSVIDLASYLPAMQPESMPGNWMRHWTPEGWIRNVIAGSWIGQCKLY